MAIGNAVMVQGITITDLEGMIDRAVGKRMEEFYDKVRKKAPVLVKRKTAASLIGISLPTLDAYAKAGFITPHHIGGRVYFDESEIESIKGR